MPVVLIYSTHFVIMEKSATRGRGIACPSLKGLLLFFRGHKEKVSQSVVNLNLKVEARVFN